MSNTRASFKPQIQIDPYLRPDNFAAICKDCGAGTLNNAAVPNFKVITGYDEFEGSEFIQCRSCGSVHVDEVTL